MGNYGSTVSNNDEFVNYDGDTTANVNVDFKDIDYSEFNEYDKNKLINYIMSMKTKNINLPDNFVEKMKDVEIDNTKLIPMSVELYHKLFELFGEFRPSKDESSKTKKKMFFVRPKFDTDAVKKSIETETVKISSPIDLTLMNPVNNAVQMKNTDITLAEFTESFNNTLTKKDMMGITKRILRDMPQYLKQRYVNVFNEILKDTGKVNEISFGRGSYMYKANKHGPTSDINSFRQIISIPNAVNQFHRILTIRLNNYISANKLVDTTIQKGGVGGQKFAIFEQYFKMKNVLKHANKNKNSVAVLFLDLSNAFGNLDLDNLYKILKYYNVDEGFVNYIKAFYDNFEYYVSAGDIKTDTFKWKNGLIQGCSLSPLLFVLALNYVLTFIDKTYKEDYGYDIDGTTKILLTAFMDDICIICKDRASLEKVYSKLKELLNTLGFPINADKCAIMAVNDNTQAGVELNKIQKVNVFKYLGEYLSNDGSSTESYIQFLKGVSRKLISIDKKSYLSNDEKYDIFTKCIVPWIQRKTMVMYDVSVTSRLKMISLIKPYLESWGHDETPNLFSNVVPIINDSDDKVVNSVKITENDIDEDLAQNIEIANYVLKDTHIKLEYNQIDDEFDLDRYLEE